MRNQIQSKKPPFSATLGFAFVEAIVFILLLFYFNFIVIKDVLALNKLFKVVLKFI